MTLVNAPITWLSILTFIGTTLGVLCVLAINAAKSVNGVLGILSGICFIVVGFTAKNYLSIGEQIAYIATLDIPVLLSKNWNVNMVSKIRKFTAKSWVISIAFTAIVFVVSGFAIQALTDDGRPFYDAFSFAVCLTAGIICFMRYNNQYFWWLASGLAQLVLWFITFKEGSATLAMFVNSAIYVANDVLAFTVSPWFNEKEKQRLMKEEKAYAEEVEVEE